MDIADRIEDRLSVAFDNCESQIESGLSNAALVIDLTDDAAMLSVIAVMLDNSASRIADLRALIPA